MVLHTQRLPMFIINMRFIICTAFVCGVVLCVFAADMFSD